VWQATRVLEKRQFQEIERDLDDTLSKLKATRDPALRHLLLRDMKLLLREADELQVHDSQSFMQSLATD
jgi:hypothetical protein